jgi:hypothetical protein
MDSWWAKRALFEWFESRNEPFTFRHPERLARRGKLFFYRLSRWRRGPSETLQPPSSPLNNECRHIPIS